MQQSNNNQLLENVPFANVSRILWSNTTTCDTSLPCRTEQERTLVERTFSYFFVGIDDLEEDANQMKDDLEGESQVTRLRTKLSSAKTTLDLRLLFNISTPGWLLHPPLPSFQSALLSGFTLLSTVAPNRAHPSAFTRRTGQWNSFGRRADCDHMVSKAGLATGHSLKVFSSARGQCDSRPTRGCRYKNVFVINIISQAWLNPAPKYGDL